MMEMLTAAESMGTLLPLATIWNTVVMEFPGITVDGSSFKHGLFKRTISRIKLVLLFSGLARAFGTTGVITALEVQLVEAKDYLRTDYISVGSAPEALEAMAKAARDISIDCIGGTLYFPNAGVACLGCLSNECPPGYRLQELSRAQGP